MELLTVVNKERPLKPTYIPKGLVCDPVSGIWVTKDVYRHFYLLNQQLQQEGLSRLVLVSGYRSYQYQKMLYIKKVNALLATGTRKEEALYKASNIVAPAGCSEHQLGLSIDVTNEQMAVLEDPLITSFGDTTHGQWMKANGKNYGFILRYPEEKMDVTHITYEPWHYRFVGINHAKKMEKYGLCLEEYEKVYLSLRTQ